MSKKAKKSKMDLYYMKNGQAKNKTIIEEKERKKKEKEREKRIKEKKQETLKDEFDLETETVLQMTNRKKKKKEEEKRKQLSKEQRRRKKRNKRIKTILKIIIFLGIISGGIVFALTSPIFNIKDIKVIDNNQVSQDTIISLSGLNADENIFKFYSNNIEDKIKENPYIEDVKVHRKIPNTIEIDVKERVAKYSVDYMGKYAYINTQGYILEIAEDNKKMPIIQGISTSEEEVIPGKRLNNDDLNKLEDVIKILDSANENGLDGKVTSIDISNKNEYSIYIEEENKKVHLGDSTNLSNKMLYVMAIIEAEKGKQGDIFVNGDLNNKFQPYFREKV